MHQASHITIMGRFERGRAVDETGRRGRPDPGVAGADVYQTGSDRPRVRDFHPDPQFNVRRGIR